MKAKRAGQGLVYMGMSVPQARQLLWYIDRTDDYYGNQKQFREREDQLIHVLQVGIDRATANRSSVKP